MKKNLLLTFVGLLFISCSVDPIETELQNSQLIEMNAISGDGVVGCAGPDNSMTITYDQAISIESWDEVRKLYLSLLKEGVRKDGEFDPTIWDIIHKFNDDEEGGLGEYTTWYTIDTEECKDSVKLTIFVVPNPSSSECSNFSAGSDNLKTITHSQAEALESWDEVRKLYLSLLDQGVAINGEFDPSIWDLIRSYWEKGLGDYSTVYTITNGACTDSVILTIRVIEDEQSNPTCSGTEAGPDNSMTISYSDAAAIESWDEVRKLYLSLLAPGVPTNGNFDPSIWDLINRFNDLENGGPGNYTTVYTVSVGECTDSVSLTITVTAD